MAGGGSGELRIYDIDPLLGHLKIRKDDAGLALTWETGLLQSAASVDAPFITVPGASSPFLLVPSDYQRLYRVLVE